MTQVGPLEVDPDKDVSYINITLLSIETNIKEIVKESNQKVRFPMVQKFLAKDSVQNKLASSLSKIVTPSMVAKGMSEQWPKLLMYVLHQKIGMTVAVKTIFVEDAYIVLEFQVKHVDTQKMILAQIQQGIPKDGGMDDEDLEVPTEILDAWIQEMEGQELPVVETTAEAAESITRCTVTWTTAPNNQGWDWFAWIAAQFEYAITQLKKILEHDTMPAAVQKNMTETMGAIVVHDLEKELLEAEIAVLPSETQARYFFANLERVRDRKKEKRWRVDNRL